MNGQLSAGRDARKKLADALDNRYIGDGDPPVTHMAGTVDGTSPLTVALRGASHVEIGCLASYTPTIDDVVLIAGTPGALVVIGKLTDGS